MNKKTIFTIIAILVIPLLAFWGINLNKSSEAVAQNSGRPQIFKFSSTMCLECKQQTYKIRPKKQSTKMCK